MEDARRFWRDTFAWCQQNRDVTVREVQPLLGFLGLEPAMRAADARHDLIPTIAWNGDVVLLSPELLGVADAAYHDFVAGNVMTDTLPTILRRAGDRYFEHGTFTATETNHCRTSVQALADLVEGKETR